MAFLNPGGSVQLNHFYDSSYHPVIPLRGPVPEGTVMCWQTHNTTTRSALAFKNAAGHYIELRSRYDDAAWEWRVSDGSAEGSPITATYEMSRWYHVAGTWRQLPDGVFHLKIFVNGQLEVDWTSTKAIAWGMASSSAASGLDGAIYGRMAGLKVWTSELEQGEVQREMTSLNAIRYANLWLDGPSSGMVIDHAFGDWSQSHTGHPIVMDGGLLGTADPPVAMGAPPPPFHLFGGAEAVLDASDYLENAVLDHTIDGATMAQPSGVYVSLHSGDPGETGANEISGGSYARTQATSWGPASGGSKIASSSVAFTGLPAMTVNGYAIWDAVSGGNCLYTSHQLGTPVTVASGDEIEFKTGGANLVVTLN